MELHEALKQVSIIRFRMAQAETFHGYRARPTAISGLIAFAAAAAQSVLVPDPTADFRGYLLVWFGAAALAILVTGAELVAHCRSSAAPLSREKASAALTLLLPALLAGGAITLVIATRIPGAIGLLPGLWQLLYGLGLFSSLRVLPRELVVMAITYLVSGAGVLALGASSASLSPWAMGMPFGLGQILGAWLLWRTERCHA